MEKDTVEKKGLPGKESEPPKRKTSKGNEVLISVIKFVPLLVFAVLVIVFQLDLLIAAPIATFTALAVYMLLNRERSFEKAFEHGLAATRKIALIFFILMFAYGVAECFMATGVGASLILLALKLGITARTVAIVSMLVTCVLSIATGSSWGTFAACAPIFLWLNHLVGGDVILTLCAIAGGSCFGDNIGMISDVTVLSCGMQDVKIIDRINNQLNWFAPAGSEPCFYVLDSCPAYIRELEVYSWKEEKDNEPEDGHDHMINAVQYAWLPHEKRIYHPGERRRNGP